MVEEEEGRLWVPSYLQIYGAWLACLLPSPPPTPSLSLPLPMLTLVEDAQVSTNISDLGPNQAARLRPRRNRRPDKICGRHW